MENIEIEKIHIGKIVSKALSRSKLTKSEFAREIDVYSQNINRMLESEDWSAIKLIKAGEVLGVDFSFLFGKQHKKAEKSKMILQIEIEEDKFNDVLKNIENKDLYNILKK